MEIYIIEDDLVSNIQREFRKCYPYLKLQFYKTSHREGESSGKADRISSELPLSEVTMFHTGGKINIDPERTVAQVEADFLHQFSLCVQVMRQSGGLWLQTTDTDHWTLQQQNEEGRVHSIPLESEKPADFDLQDFN